ncbi:transposase, partial [Eggerthella lenta]|nr:transposase [Eggerthella lenta]
LHSFDIRVSKRAKNYKMRKNINHKLAMLQPSTFRKQMEYIYQDRHGLLLEVNTIDTSKTCNKCGFINHDLKFEKQWTCPHCHQK